MNGSLPNSPATTRNRLLPTGLEDLATPVAAKEAQAIEQIVACFDGFGYDRVKPPLLEFEATLFTGIGDGLNGRSFRVMDPVSNQMLALRPDMTVQVARIAEAQLARGDAEKPAPVRLCYAGQVVRVDGTDLRPQRQFTQAGCEIVGLREEDCVAADAEAIRVAITALRRVGINALTIDISLPSLMRTLADTDGLMGIERQTVLKACDQHDWATLNGLSNPAYRKALETVGEAGATLKALKAASLPQECAWQLDQLEELLDLLASFELADFDLAGRLRVDPAEQRGTNYHVGLGFTLFSSQVKGELGRGGRYQLPTCFATGNTLYLDTILQAAPEVTPLPTVEVPIGTSDQDLDALRAKGYRCILSAAQKNLPKVD